MIYSVGYFYFLFSSQLWWIACLIVPGPLPASNMKYLFFFFKNLQIYKDLQMTAESATNWFCFEFFLLYGINLKGIQEQTYFCY